MTKKYVMSLKDEFILNFYQKEMPSNAFTEDIFLIHLQSFIVDDDLLSDLEGMYKVSIASKVKLPEFEY